ncbi:MAG: mucoidy inhibitor MuiA family protein [Bacteroidales bacterium]|nr:mucoidy inhibitor MuiA family protein [Bacteroidales bacterium]MDT8430457.1 mucoidy inhibitor MuiA family protein [Bacteroidales bacterium]
MKKISFLILCLAIGTSYAQDLPEKEVTTEVSEVTVFLEGAQVTREKSIALDQGKSLVKFVKLSPFIDAKSLQVKAEGDITVLSVNHQQNYLEEMERSEELQQLEKALKEINEQVMLEQTHLSIIREEIGFLQENRNLGGRNEQVSVTTLQQAADFYGKQLTTLKLNDIERSKNLRELNRKSAELQKQISALSSKKQYPSGEILVKVDAVSAKTYTFTVSYTVSNAGWFPSYDIRVKDISTPAQLIYKANVRQDTKVDWKNVRLAFSSSDPNVSGVAPELQTYYLSYNLRPPTYDLISNSVSGKVMDSEGGALPGANIAVTGTTIGTVADFDGNYSITIPNSASQLTYSFIGFESQTLPISGPVMNVALVESAATLEEVVVVGYGSDKSVRRSLQNKASGVIAVDDEIRIRGTSSIPVPVARTEKQTTVEFEIETPYTIKSDNKSFTVDMQVSELPAFYQYYCVPKIDNDAFLIANIVDWEQYNLLEGEANVFFEETYVGKTLLDVRFASDTLQVSLGRDKKVSVSREKIRDYTSKRFIGTKKEETRAWKTTVKNNKNREISMVLIDQVPVSASDEIEVDVQKISGATHDRETGEIKWEFDLAPSAATEFELRYAVKHPKNRVLIIE